MGMNTYELGVEGAKLGQQNSSVTVFGDRGFREVTLDEVIRVEPELDMTGVLIRRGRSTVDLSFLALTENRACADTQTATSSKRGLTTNHHR